MNTCRHLLLPILLAGMVWSLLPGETSAGGPAPSGGTLSSKVFPCPAALVPGPGAIQGVLRAAHRDAPGLYGGGLHRRFEVVGLLSLGPHSFGPTQPWYNTIKSRCGASVARRSWVVFINFTAFNSGPNTSASLSEGIVFAARTGAGWKVWFLYR